MGAKTTIVTVTVTKVVATIVVGVAGIIVVVRIVVEEFFVVEQLHQSVVAEFPIFEGYWGRLQKQYQFALSFQDAYF